MGGWGLKNTKTFRFVKTIGNPGPKNFSFDEIVTNELLMFSPDLVTIILQHALNLFSKASQLVSSISSVSFAALLQTDNTLKRHGLIFLQALSAWLLKSRSLARST